MKMLEDLDKATAGWSDLDCFNFVSTHHAAIADMAKRLEAAERDAEELRDARRMVWVLARCRGAKSIPLRVLEEYRESEAIIETYWDETLSPRVVARLKSDAAIQETGR